MANTYDISMYQASFDDIADKWQALEANNHTSIFLSWLWVSVWLVTFKPRVELLVVRSQGVIVGLSLVTITKQIRHRLLRSRIVYFGRTGQPDLDQIWPEYGGIVFAKGHEKEAAQAIIRYLLSTTNWDEIELAATPAETIAHFQTTHLKSVEKWSAPALGVDLKHLRDNKCEFLSSLSRNTRYQINRCKKTYLKTESLHFEVLRDEGSIFKVWPEVEKLHRAKWDHTKEKSGFSNPSFTYFHRSLIEQGCRLGAVELCELRLGDKVLGFLYNFIHRNQVFFYLSALVEEQDTRLKPGLLLHSYAIQHYLNHGFDYYDFMGGDGQYKRSLGSTHSHLQTVYLQRKISKLKIEQCLRQAKQLFFGSLSGSFDWLQAKGTRK